MMYRKIDLKEEIAELKKFDVVAWSGKELKHLIVTVEDRAGEKWNKKYYFTDRKDYSHFISKLRRLCE